MQVARSSLDVQDHVAGRGAPSAVPGLRQTALQPLLDTLHQEVFFKMLVISSFDNLLVIMLLNRSRRHMFALGGKNSSKFSAFVDWAIALVLVSLGRHNKTPRAVGLNQ